MSDLSSLGSEVGCVFIMRIEDASFAQTNVENVLLAIFIHLIFVSTQMLNLQLDQLIREIKGEKIFVVLILMALDVLHSHEEVMEVRPMAILFERVKVGYRALERVGSDGEDASRSI